jgi:hypothetical protein
MKSAPIEINRSTNHEGHNAFADNLITEHRQLIKADAKFLVPYLIAGFRFEIDCHQITVSDILKVFDQEIAYQVNGIRKRQHKWSSPARSKEAVNAFYETQRFVRFLIEQRGSA